MKVRDSGMPDVKIWESYFNIDNVLDKMKIDYSISDLVEIGCGYGTFTIPAADRIGGTLYTYDIERDMISNLDNISRENGINNIVAKRRDVTTSKTGLKDRSVDYVMLFNILHHKHPSQLIDEAYRVLKSNGKVGVIHWQYDAKTPAGPRMDIRLTPEKTQSLFKASLFEIDVPITKLEPYHFGFLMKKK